MKNEISIPKNEVFLKNEVFAKNKISMANNDLPEAKNEIGLQRDENFHEKEWNFTAKD